MTEWLLVVGAMRNQIVAQDPNSESHRKSTRLPSDDDDDDDDDIYYDEVSVCVSRQMITFPSRADR